jgi:hypothetical protein
MKESLIIRNPAESQRMFEWIAREVASFAMHSVICAGIASYLRLHVPRWGKVVKKGMGERKGD